MKNLLFVLTILILIVSCKGENSEMKDQTISASQLIGIDFSQNEIDSMQTELSDNLENYGKIREYRLDNSVPPALIFDPRPVGFEMPVKEISNNWKADLTVGLPENPDDLAFYSIPQLAGLLRTGKITSVELTGFFSKDLRNTMIPCSVLFPSPKKEP
jgi:hypothetical protein